MLQVLIRQHDMVNSAYLYYELFWTTRTLVESYIKSASVLRGYPSNNVFHMFSLTIGHGRRHHELCDRSMSLNTRTFRIRPYVFCRKHSPIVTKELSREIMSIFKRRFLLIIRHGRKKTRTTWCCLTLMTYCITTS